MESVSYRVTLRFAKILNILLVTIPVLLAWLFCYGPSDGLYSQWKPVWLVIGTFIALYITYGRIYESFFISMARISEMVYSQCLAMFMSDSFLYAVLCLVCRRFLPVWPMGITFIVHSFPFFVSRFCL